MNFFLRGCLIFFMIISGIVGVITVDIRTGHMAGYRPVVDMIIEEVPVEEQEDALAVGYNLTIICNKKLLSGN